MLISRAILGDIGTGISTLRTPGFVYFIRAEMTGLIKIGWATNPAVRLHNMQLQCPDILILEAKFPGSGLDERKLHARYAGARKHGEWFAPVPELLEEIEALKK